jgi:hypothetical protein
MNKHRLRGLNIVITSFVFLLCLNTVVAQKTKSEKQIEHAQFIKSIVIDSQRYVFTAHTALPISGGMKILSSGYDVIIKKDSVDSHLPFYGKAYAGVSFGSTTSPLEFISTKFNYTITDKKKDGGWDISIQIKDQSDVKSMEFSIFDNGTASLRVMSNNRSTMSFQGDIEAIHPKKK